jgi:hypothetical protein
MACKGSGVQIPSAPPQVSGLMWLHCRAIHPPRAADTQQSRARVAASPCGDSVQPTIMARG